MSAQPNHGALLVWAKSEAEQRRLELEGYRVAPGQRIHPTAHAWALVMERQIAPPKVPA
jgi:hypothetical protein